MSDDFGFHRAFKQVGILFGAIAAVSLLLWWWAHTHPVIHVANGLDEPLVVTATRNDESHPVTVGPRGHESMRLEAGAWTVTVRSETGAELESFPITVEASDGPFIVNPFGAAPLFFERVKYVEKWAASPKSGSDDVVRFHGGERSFHEEHADHVFESLPDTVMGSRNPLTRSTVVTHLDMFEGGWRHTIEELLQRGNPTAASEVLGSLLAARPELELGSNSLREIAESLGPDDGKKFVEAVVAKVRARHPDAGWLLDFQNAAPDQARTDATP